MKVVTSKTTQTAKTNKKSEDTLQANRNDYPKKAEVCRDSTPLNTNRTLYRQHKHDSHTLSPS